MQSIAKGIIRIIIVLSLSCFWIEIIVWFGSGYIHVFAKPTQGLSYSKTFIIESSSSCVSLITTPSWFKGKRLLLTKPALYNMIYTWNTASFLVICFVCYYLHLLVYHTNILIEFGRIIVLLIQWVFVFFAKIKTKRRLIYYWWKNIAQKW
jgi:hypothetical protein